MATEACFPMITSKFTTNCGTHGSKLKQTYSTSLFPANLKHVFSEPPPAAVAATAEIISNEEDAAVKNAKPTKSKRARSMAGLINTKPWSSRLESSLSAISPLSQTTFFQTLRLIKTPSKALNFFNWARDSGFAHNQQSYFMMLEILGRARNLNAARNFLFSIPAKSNNAVPLTDKFFNSLIRSYGDAGLFQESMKVFKVMKSIGVSPSTVTFNSLFLILFKKGRLGIVLELYDEMLKTYGAKPDVYTFNLLIRGFCMNSKIDEAFRVFKQMERFDCEPDLVTYNTIVDGLCRAGKIDIAGNVVKGMCKKCENLRPNVVTYTTLIRGYCGKREIDKALDVFRGMVDGGIKPNQITFNTIIQGFSECQKVEVMKEILREFEGESLGFVPDTCTFNTLMNSQCNREKLDEALKIFEKMKELNVKRDSATYSILIRSLCHKGNFEKAEEMLDELIEEEILLCDDNCSTPLAAAYNPIFEYLCRNGKTPKADKAIRQLMKRGIQDPLSFETLISGHCKEETFKDGHKMLVLMLRRHFVPSFKIYESLIEGLLQKGEANLAHDTLQKMLRSTHIPRTSIFHRVVMGLLENGSALESANLVMLMLEKEIRLNVNLSTDVVRLLFESSMLDRAFQIVGRIYESGFVVKVEELISFLCQDRKLLEASELLVFSLKNDQSLDIAQCSTVLTGLCKVRRLKEAFQLYYELLEKSIELPFKCLEDLRNALESGGKLKEAEFVSKRMVKL